MAEIAARLARLPATVALVAVAGAAMLVPGVHGLATGAPAEARVWLAWGGLTLALAAMMAMALASRPARPSQEVVLLTLLASYVLLPLLLALPFHQSIGNTRLLNAYVEMVSSFTTTGATLFDQPGRLSDGEQLWRALVGWLGGLHVLVVAATVFAPLSVGGFEVLDPEGTERAWLRRMGGGDGAGLGAGQGSGQGPGRRAGDARARREAARLAAVYSALTLAVWIALLIAGDRPLVAFCHALSTLATSGISPVGGLSGASSGWAGEGVIALFMLLALTRRSYVARLDRAGRAEFLADRELRLGLAIVAGVSALLFLRHWFGALEIGGRGGPAAAAEALWGALFTSASFLTTTGFVSSGWAAAQDWSGLHTPGLLLMGLAVFGGGVATTAGGVKLLRIHALGLHGQRELERLVHPSSVAGRGAAARLMRGRGAYVAWLFFMLFAVSVAATMLAFSLAGQDFESAVVLTVAALTTTGPIVEVAAARPLALIELGDGAKLLFAAAMVVGRLEVLAIVALVVPEGLAQLAARR